jgi:hypothetical protein
MSLSTRLPLTLGLFWLDAKTTYTLSPSKRGEGQCCGFSLSPRLRGESVG